MYDEIQVFIFLLTILMVTVYFNLGIYFSKTKLLPTHKTVFLIWWPLILIVRLIQRGIKNGNIKKNKK